MIKSTYPMSSPSSPMQVAIRAFYLLDLNWFMISICFFWFMPESSSLPVLPLVAWPMKTTGFILGSDARKFLISKALFLFWVNMMALDELAMFTSSLNYSFSSSWSFIVFRRSWLSAVCWPTHVYSSWNSLLWSMRFLIIFSLPELSVLVF